MNGISYKKAAIIAVIFCALLASPVIFVFASMVWASSCSTFYAYTLQNSLEKNMDLVSAKRKLRGHMFQIHELNSKKCDSDGRDSYPSYKSVGGPCVFANLQIEDFVCKGNRVHARLFFNAENSLVNWETLDANAYL